MDAKPSLIVQNSPTTLPDGKGNNLVKRTCPKCGTRYSYWAEEGDPGCVNCEVNESIERTRKDRQEKEASDRKAFDEAVAAEVKKQIAAVMAERAAGSKDPAEYPQDEQEKPQEDKKKRPFSKK